MKILYVQYTNPANYPPLGHSSEILADAGWEILFLGTRSLGREQIFFQPHERVRTHLLSAQKPGIFQKVHYFFYLLWVLWNAFFWRPDFVYASDALSCPVALALHFFLKISIVYHEHDYARLDSTGFFSKMLAGAHQRVGALSQICVLPNIRRRDLYLIQTGANSEKVFCVYNCPLAREARSRGSSEISNRDFWVCYQGSIVPARLPLNFIEALSRLPHSVKLRIIGYETLGSKGYLQQIRERAAAMGVSSRLDILGVLSREDTLRQARNSHLGISVMPKNTREKNLCWMVGASNKSFDYLACGIPLLVSDLPDWMDAFVKPGYGVTCDSANTESIVIAIRWHLEHPDESKAMGERGRQRILLDWNYEAQFKPVFEGMSRCS